jgi:hypothetical protein
MALRLFVVAGPDRGAAFTLHAGAPLLVGRDQENNVRLRDGYVSGVHCQVALEDGSPVVTDRGSTTGTFVNGARVRRHMLRHGDLLRVGETHIRYEEDGRPDETDRSPVWHTMAPHSDLLPAARLHELSGTSLGRFDLGPLLARGRSGLTFSAIDHKHLRNVALQVLWPELARDRDELRRLLRAVRMLLPLQHPHLVTTYGAGRTAGYVWVAVELVEGESLAALLRRLGPGNALAWRPALDFAVQVARALAYMHYHGVVHRSITPDDVLIRSHDRLAKLSGLLTAQTREGRPANDLTRPQEAVGDVRFQSPERATGAAGLDARTDVYGLGATLYAMLTGRPPVEGKSAAETIYKIHHEVPVPPRQFQPGMPGALELAVLKMLARSPEYRFQAAAELLGHLCGIQAADGSPP